MNIIEELYYGNLCADEQGMKANSSYAKAVKKVTDAQKALSEYLEGNICSQLTAMMEAYNEMECIAQQEGYVRGFRTGARFILDTFVADSETMFKETMS